MVALAIASVQEMPFHGPGGPGTEPMYIGFRWTVVLTTTGGAGATVSAIRAEVRESRSGTQVAVSEPALLDRSVRPGTSFELPQEASGLFDSALYPGRWRGRVSVDLAHPGGRIQTLETSFSFR